MSRRLDKFLPKAKTPIKPFPEGSFFKKNIFYEKGLKETSESRLVDPTGAVEAVAYWLVLVSASSVPDNTPPAVDN